jgi:glutamine amidotransferase/cyclase
VHLINKMAEAKRAKTTGTVSLLDYGAGNVRSVRNAIRRLGYVVDDISTPEQIDAAKVLIFPGVGSFGNAMKTLEDRGLVEALRAYVKAGRPFFGICLGMQTLFEGSEESPGVAGLGVIPGVVKHFRAPLPAGSAGSAPAGVDLNAVTVPHIGWNGLSYGGERASSILEALPDPSSSSASSSTTQQPPRVYFVHSFRVVPEPACADWVLTTTTYAGMVSERFENS